MPKALRKGMPRILALGLEEGAISAIRLEDIGLGGNFPRSVHRKHGNAGIDDVHAVLCGNVGDGSAAARVNLAKFGGLEGNARRRPSRGVRMPRIRHAHRWSRFFRALPCTC